MIKKRTCFNERTDQYKIPSEDILILQTIILVSVEQEHLTAKKKNPLLSSTGPHNFWS